MWFENDSTIIYANSLEGKKANIIFSHKYLQPITPSNRVFKRDYLIERKDSFDIVGISHHYYRNSLYIFGEKYYNGQTLELDFEPSNEYNSDAIVIRMLGRKLGYIERYATDDVSRIMYGSKHYRATLDCSCMGYERINLFYVKEFHDTYALPYQTDLILISTRPAVYNSFPKFIRRSIGHAITFEKSERNGLIALVTDMQSIIGYIDDTFIAKQYNKTPIVGFIEDVIKDESTKTVEIKIRLLMEKSTINSKYLKSYYALQNYFGSFYDAGTYRITLADLIKAVPKKTRTLSAYNPLVKYLKEYHAITLNIMD